MVTDAVPALAALRRLSGHTVALKIYQPDKLHEISQFQLLREARLHTHLSHPNIVRLYAAFQQVRLGNSGRHVPVHV